jgi:lipopolysaccharide export system protein LptC
VLRGEGTYSKAVAFLKVVLPLFALALLSTLFLFARSREPGMAVPFADAIRNGEVAQERLNAPSFSGTTRRGDMLTMSAAHARPVGEGLIAAEALSAKLILSDGSQIQMRSDTALLTEAAREIALTGSVVIESSTGYVVTTEGLISSISETSARTTGPVQGSGPAGTIEAGALEIQTAENGEDVQLLFTGGVKLIYEPPR